MLILFFKQKTAYEMRISDWSSDVCSSDLAFMLLATNRPEVIDQAVLRDGRCDFKITVKKPTAEAVEVSVRDRTSVVSGKRVSVSVDLGCRRNIKKYRQSSGRTS